MYRYFKAGVQVDIRLTPSIYHQGSLIVAPMPGIKLGSPYLDTVYRMSGFPAVVLSFSPQASATVTMNWNSPFPYYDTTLSGNACGSQIGSVGIATLTPYRDLSNTGSFTMRVFAKFLRPHVAAPLPVESTRKVQHQSETGVVMKTPAPVDVENLVKTDSHQMISKQQASPLSPIMDIIGTGMNVVQQLGSLTGLFDKPTSTTSGEVMIHRIARDFTQTTGLDYSQRLSQYPQSHLANSKMFGKQYTSHSSVSAIAQIPMLHHISYLEQGSMPNTLISLLVHPAETDSSSYAAGQWDFFTYISRACRFYRGSIKYFIKFVCPTFVKSRVRITLHHEGAASTGTKGDLFTRIVEISGDTDVSFTVPFLYNRYWDLTAPPGEGTPYLLIELIDNVTGGASGSTPIIDVLIFRSAGEDMCFSNLLIANINPATATATTTVATTTTPTTTLQIEKVEHQCSIRETFTKSFDTLACDCSYSIDKNLCTSDQLTSVAEILKRYSEFHNMNPAASPLNDVWIWPTSSDTTSIDVNLWWLTGLLQTANQPASVVANPFQYFLSLFLYVRGDIRVRYVDHSESTGLVYAGLLDINRRLAAGNSMVISDLHATPELSFEVPYSSTIPWHPIQGPIPCSSLYNSDVVPHFAVDNGANTGFTSAYEAYIAASDNFLAGILMPPPRVWIIPAAKPINRVKTNLTRSKVRASSRRS